MVIKILLIISIILQLGAAGVAVGLMKVTRFNLSWILFTVALTVMAFMRFAEYINLTGDGELNLPDTFFVWTGIVTSLFFAVGLLLVQKILRYISKSEKQRRLSEKRLLNTVLRTEEKERRRFSKDLHDGLGPLLSSAKMSVSALERMDAGDPDAKEIIKNINYVVDEAVRSLKEISANMNPHVLDNFGLTRAISNFINRLPQAGVKIFFDTNLKAERFDEDVEVIIYRVICELISNSLKHSGAGEIHVGVIRDGACITIEYSDNGCGFDVGTIEEHKGMGFSNIMSRVGSLKGTVGISSNEGQGMEASIKLEISPSETKEDSDKWGVMWRRKKAGRGGT